jgi:SAM-dependent methyltransferase
LRTAQTRLDSKWTPPRLNPRQALDSEAMYQHVSSQLPSWISNSTGGRRPLSMGRWLGGDASTVDDRQVDESMVQLCTGPTIDVGCGPGRFTAALADLGVPALGVDISTTAVDMTIARGGMALHGDVFAPVPGCGQWSQVLLADGNIGIGGDPTRMLQRARELLHPRGTVIAELESLPTGVVREYRRWETQHFVGKWFPWSHVGSDAASSLAESAGLLVVSAVHMSDRFVVTMCMA